MKKLAVIILLACIGIACEDEKYSSRIPLAPVDLTIHLRDVDRELIASPSTKIFTRKPGSPDSDKYGYAGILVYHGITKFYAYDLSCPVEAQSDVKVVPYLSVQAKCPKCGAIYNLESGGFPESGSQYPLKEYAVIPNGNNETYKVIN